MIAIIGIKIEEVLVFPSSFVPDISGIDLIGSWDRLVSAILRRWRICIRISAEQ